MTTRSYNQLCGLAYALDVVGERWTILILRELVPGPRRFTDLLTGLPGISTNLLTTRLKHLEQSGVIQQRVLLPPAGSTVYELTPLGQGLEATLLELGKWGSQFVPPLTEDKHMLHLGAYALTPKTFFRPELAQGINETYALHIDNEVQLVRIADGKISVVQGDLPTVSQSAHQDVNMKLHEAPLHEALLHEATLYNVTLHTEMPIYLGLMTRQIELDAALAEGSIRVEGDVEALRRFLAICGVAEDV